MPFIIASIFLGWEKILPIFCILHIFLSRKTSFYYPSPRTIDLEVAKSLLISLAATYPIAIASSIRWLSDPRGVFDAYLSFLWNITHTAFPIATFLYRKFVPTSRSAPLALNRIKILYGNSDLKHMRRFQATLFLMACIMHIMTAITSVLLSNSALATTDLIGWWALTSTVFTWCCYTIWDLHRVYDFGYSLTLLLLNLLLSLIVFGPAATLTGTWMWREQALETARARQHRVEAF